MSSDYVKQLEDANHILQQKVEELQVSNENLSYDLKKYAVRLKNFSKNEWAIFIGYYKVGKVTFHPDGCLYSISYGGGEGIVSDKFTSLDLCREEIIRHITEKPKGDGWKVTI